jgi:hypothetical protein
MLIICLSTICKSIYNKVNLYVGRFLHAYYVMLRNYPDVNYSRSLCKCNVLLRKSSLNYINCLLPVVIFLGEYFYALLTGPYFVRSHCIWLFPSYGPGQKVFKVHSILIFRSFLCISKQECLCKRQI